MPLTLDDLDREQRRTAEEIYRQGRFVPRRLRAKFRQAALETGLVEANLRNPDYGDGTSVGWRQEISSYGSVARRRNVRGSVRRFRQEFLQHADPGETAGEIAAQVQRPREDLRWKYGARRGDARSLRLSLRAEFGGRGGGRRRAAGGGAQGAAFDPGSPQALAALEQQLPPEARVPAGGGPSSSLDARANLALPAGYQAVQSAGGPAPRRSPLEDMIAQQGIAVRFGEHAEKAAAGGRRGLAGKLRAGRVNPEVLADEIQAWAGNVLGIEGGSRDRSVSSNAAAGGSGDSDHLSGGRAFRGREAVDLPTTAAAGGWEQYRRVVRRLGLRPADDGFTQGTIKVGGKRFRVQVIFGEAHDHGDHIHVGFRRV